MGRYIAIIFTFVFISIFSSSASAIGGACTQNFSTQTTQSTTETGGGNNSKPSKSSGPATMAMGGCNDDIVPGVPPWITAPTTSSSGSYTITWGTSSGDVKNYILEESKNGGSYVSVGTVTTTSKALSGKGSGSYRYRVKACGFTIGCSSYQTETYDSVVRIKPVTPGTANPTTSTDTNSVTVSWSSVTNATYYNIQRRNNGGSWSTAASNVSGTSKSLSGFSNGNWDFRIQACNEFSWSCSAYGADGSSVNWRAIPGTPAAPNPSTSTDTDSVTVTWSTVSNATYYNIQRRNNSGSWTTAATSVTGTSKSLSGFSDGSWDFRIQACNTYSWACSSYSTDGSSVTWRVKPGTPAAANPTTSTDTNNVTVSWSTVTNATYYDIQKRLNGGSWTTASTGATGTSKSISGLTDGSWDFRIRACNGYSWACSGYGVDGSSVTWRAVPAIPAAANPTTSTDTDSVTVSWSAVSSATYYDIQKRVNGGSWTTAATSVSGTSKSLSGFTDGSWDFRIRACNTHSWACSSYGVHGSSVNWRTKPATPATANPTTSTDTDSVTVSWSAVSNATYYDIQRRLNSGSWNTVASSVTGTSTSLSGFSDGSWDFRIRACNGYSWACSSYGADGSSVTWRLKPGTPIAPQPTTSTDTNSVTVSWTAQTSATYYNIDRRNNSGTWDTIATNATGTSKSISGFSDGSWDFRIQACNGYSWACSSYSPDGNSVTWRAVPVVPAAADPTTSTDTDDVTVSWASVSGATYYDIEKRNNAGTWTSAATGATGTSESVSGLTDGSWDFRIRACNGFSWACSSYGVDGSSVTWRAKPSVPAAPTLPSSNTNGAYTVSWVKPSGAVSYYDLDERKNNTGTWTTVADNTTATSKALNSRGDGDYDYRVRACNEFDWACSSYSSISLDVSVLNPPGTPASISNNATDSDGSLSINWVAGSGQVGDYRLEEQKNSGTWDEVSSGSTSLSKTLSGRGDGSYLYRVRACNTSGCSGYRTGGTTLVVAIKPAVPAAPGGPSTSTGSAALSWSSVTNATYYDVQKRNNAGSWVTAKSGDTNTSETISGLTDGSWDYRVRACNTYSWSCSNYSVDSTDTTVRLIPFTPAAPTAPADDIDGSYTVNWTKPAGTVSVYDVQERVNNGGWATIANDTPNLSVTVSNRNSGDYDYRVRACNDYSWACSGYSSASTDVAVLNTPSVPGVSGPASSTTGQFSISWPSDSDAENFTIERRVNSGSWDVLASSVTTTSHAITETTNQTFEYRVKGCNSQSCSNFSSAHAVSVLIVEDFAQSDPVTVPDATLVSPIVPANEAVGAVEGSAGVSGGAANYSIPIALPPGRAGMQPSVSLNYSSRSGNGIAGVGWGLSAGSAISRCGATAAQDGFTAAIQYDAGRDRLCLDGQRLIAVSGVYGQSGTIYRTELDSFARVTQSGGINGTSTSFTVEHKNGMISTYGVDENSHQIAEGKTVTLSWLISDSSDRAGNSITYDYTQVGNGEVVLEVINYTGYQGSSGDRHVRFHYESRPDQNTSYLAGGKTRSTQRLKQITTEYITTVREYNLVYTPSIASDRSLLRSVEECAWGNAGKQCLTPTSFEWQEKENTYVHEQLRFTDPDDKVSEVGASPTVVHNDKRWLHEVLPHGDINGDGVKDWEGYHVNAEGEVTDTHTNLIANCYAPRLSFKLVCMDADLNADGRSDSIRRNTFNDKLEVRLTNAWGNFLWTNTNIDWINRSPSGYTSWDDRPLGFADFNGDGFVDLAYKINKQLNIYFHSGDITAASPYSPTNYQTVFTYTYDTDGVKPKKEADLMGDMDGNGIPDFVVHEYQDKIAHPVPDYIILAHSQPNGGMTTTTRTIDVNNFSMLVRGEMFFDINADGLTDLLALDTTDTFNHTLRYRINDGTQFIPGWIDTGLVFPTSEGSYQRINGETETYKTLAMSKLLMMDYNGDGRQEILYADQVVASGCQQLSNDPVKCDDALYGLTESAPGKSGFSSINSAIMDESVRQYTAIYFNENSDGSITAVTDSNTGIIASASQTAVLDATGDGLPDVVTVIGCRFTGSCTFNTQTGGAQSIDYDEPEKLGTWINRNVGASNGVALGDYEAQDVLKSVENALGVRSEWVHRPLSSDQYETTDSDFYYLDHSYQQTDPDYFHFASSMYVVASFTQSNGIGGTNETLYRYEGAMYNNKGYGFQGFRKITVDNPNGLRASTEFHQKFPLAGKIETMRTCQVEDGVCDNSNSINKTSVTYSSVNTANSAVYWVIPTNTTEENYALNNHVDWLSQKVTIIDTANTDSYGNVLFKTTTIDGGFGKQVIETTRDFDYSKVDEWWINKLNFSSVTTKKLDITGVGWAIYSNNASLDSDKTVTTTIDSYDSLDSRQPSKVITTSSDGLPITVDSVFNQYGLPTFVTTSSGAEVPRTVVTDYSNNGETASVDGYFVFKVTNDLNQTMTTHTYPEHGQVKKIIDANFLETSSEYDAFGRVEKVTPPVGQPISTRFAWCKGGCGPVVDSNIQYAVTTYQAGAPETTVYQDKFNRALITKTKKLGGGDVFVNVTYNGLGQKTFESIPSESVSGGVGTTYAGYDVLGRLLGKDVPQTRGQLLTVDYNYEQQDATTGKNYRTEISLNNYDRVLYRTHSGTGQLMQTTDALVPTAGITRYAYDGMGNPIVLQDANGEQITATYNALGQKKSVDDPNMGSKSFTYTGFGEVKTETDAIGNVTTYGYDAIGRLSSRGVAGPNENATSYFTFDNPNGDADKCVGLPSEETKDDGSAFKKTYHYNDSCQLEIVKTTIDNTDTFEVITQFDSNYGRPKALTYPGGLNVAYEYSEEGYLTRTYNAVSGYTYREITGVDSQGNWTIASLVNNNADIFRKYYPETGQMEESEWYSSATLQQKVSYLYEGYGNLESQTVLNALSQSTTESYVYDEMNRLLQSSRGATPTEFRYDAVGNIERKTDFSADTANAYTYGSSNRSASNGWAGPNAVRTVALSGGGTRTYSYDENGNMKSDGIRFIDYNGFNKPTKIEITSSATINPVLDSQATGASTAHLYYGSDQMRYKQVKNVNGDTSTHIYIGKLFERVIKTESGNTKVESKSYIDDIAVVTEAVESGVTTFDIAYFHRDRLGSMTAEVNASGQIEKSHSFDAFGRPRNEDFSSKISRQQLLGFSTNRGFTDHEHLDESQLIHMNGRVYDYNLGRFLSVDPFIQEPGNSQSMNPYSYIMNNPLAGTDPSGYKSQTETFKIRRKKTGSNMLQQVGERKTKTVTNDQTGEVVQSTSVTKMADGSFKGTSERNNGQRSFKYEVTGHVENTKINSPEAIAAVPDKGSSDLTGSPIKIDRFLEPIEQQDISPEDKAKKEYQALEQKLRTTAYNNPDSILSLSKKDLYTILKWTYFRTLNEDRHKILGRLFNEQFAGYDTFLRGSMALDALGNRKFNFGGEIIFGYHINYIAVGMLAAHYGPGIERQIDSMVLFHNTKQAFKFKSSDDFNDVIPGTKWALIGAGAYHRFNKLDHSKLQ